MQPYDDRSGSIRVLVTGAGGPAGIAVMKSLSSVPSVEALAADMDAWAAGLYLVPAQNRVIVPAGDAGDFVPALIGICERLSVDVVVPTVDAELMPLALSRDDFARRGVALMLAPDKALAQTLDKLALARVCADAVRVPRTESLDTPADPASWTYPVIVKPRSGSGSRGVSMPQSAAELAAIGARPGYLVQEYLPGDEYSVDVLADGGGRVAAAVPRLRARVDSGVSVAGRTVRNAELENFGAAVATAVGLTYIGNVQCRRDRAGRLALLEVNPRPPGSMPLTIASGVDMPRLALEALRGGELPAHAGFTETAMVRFLDERFVTMAEVEQVSA